MKPIIRFLLLTGVPLGTLHATGACSSPECEDLDACGTYQPPGDDSGGTSGEAGDGPGATGGTTAGGSGTGGITGGTGGSSGEAGAGQGGFGGSEPCNGECERLTPICLEATDTCVECTQRSHCEAPTPACDTGEHVCVECLASTDCDDPTPVCDTDAQQCVECLRSTDCDDPTPVCDTDAQECVECLESEDCADAAASRCTSTNTCAACTNNADCAHIPGKNVCDGGTCVQCTATNETACGANSCNPATKACTMTARGSVGMCRPCAADSECLGGNQADPDTRCVSMDFQAVTRPGGFCLKRAARTCSRPYMVATSRASLSGAPIETYCGIDQANVRCEAILDLIASRTCTNADNTQCGCARDRDGNCVELGQGGICRNLLLANDRCTYQCGTDEQCPNGVSCGMVTNVCGGQ